MTSINSSASLIAAQVYGAANTKQHQAQSETKSVKPRFEVDDKVTLQSAGGEAKPAPKLARAAVEAGTPDTPPRRDTGAGQREAINPNKPAYKRPGSLVDLRA